MSDDTLRRAVALYRQDHREEARQLVADLLRKHPNHAPAWIVMAQLVDDPARSLQCWRKASQLNPDDPRIHQQINALEVIQETKTQPGWRNQTASLDPLISEPLPPSISTVHRTRPKRWRIVVPVLLMALLVTCGAGLGAAASYTGIVLLPWNLRLDPCGPYRVGDTIAPLERAAARFDDQVEIAVRTPRIGLADPVARLQSIRSDTAQLSMPICAEVLRKILVSSMDDEIESFLSFLEEDENGSNVYYASSLVSRIQYEENRIRMLTGQSYIILPAEDHIATVQAVIAPPIEPSATFGSSMNNHSTGNPTPRVTEAAGPGATMRAFETSVAATRAAAPSRTPTP